MSEKKPGFDVPCLRCGETGGVWIRADDMTQFQCNECEHEFDIALARKAAEEWGRYVAWIDSMAAQQS